jgi:anthranilate phosphoribosyltransferase
MAAVPMTLPTPADREEAVERTCELLSGHGLDSHRVLVALNAAHLLVISELAASLSEGMAVAEEILRSGEVLATVASARATDRDA